MSRVDPHHRSGAVSLLLLLLVVTGCATMPDSGSVHTRPDPDTGSADAAPYFAPPGPRPGAIPEEIVRGFLLAMQANPPSTVVARQFLSSLSSGTWNPSRGTIVYEARPSIADTGDAVRVRLSDAHRLDARGGWLSAPPGRTTELQLRLVKQQGEWRIANPPDALAVPTSYFERLFSPFELYFFDQTKRVLVPEKVYLPTGRQTAANLVRGLLLGPGRDLRAVTRTAFPQGARLDLGVVVTGAGIAEVPLRPGILKLSPLELSDALAQLSLTLRQVPGISRLRLSVDGAPVPLPGGRTDVSVGEAADRTPGASVTDRDPVAVRGGRVVRLRSSSIDAVGGPLGRRGFALRSLAMYAGTRTVAGVSANGRRVFVAPLEGEADPERVRTPLESATDLLRPDYDMFATLWLVDRTAEGAEVYVVANGRTRRIRVPGITGSDVSGFTVTPDGTRFVATAARGAEPQLLVSQVIRAPSGQVVRAVRARSVVVPGGDLGPAVDVGLVGPTTLALLTQRGDAPARVVLAQIDGSPGESDSLPEPLPARARALVASPYDETSLRVLTTDGRLLQLSAAGDWIAEESDQVVAAALPR